MFLPPASSCFLKIDFLSVCTFFKCLENFSGNRVKQRIRTRQIVSCMTSHQIGKKSHTEPHQSGDIESLYPLGLVIHSKFALNNFNLYFRALNLQYMCMAKYSITNPPNIFKCDKIDAMTCIMFEFSEVQSNIGKVGLAV